jgi:hypothetical protein
MRNELKNHCCIEISLGVGIISIAIITQLVSIGVLALTLLYTLPFPNRRKCEIGRSQDLYCGFVL